MPVGLGVTVQGPLQRPSVSGQWPSTRMTILSPSSFWWFPHPHSPSGTGRTPVVEWLSELSSVIVTGLAGQSPHAPACAIMLAMSSTTTTPTRWLLWPPITPPPTTSPFPGSLGLASPPRPLSATGKAVTMAFCPRGRDQHSLEASWNLPSRGGQGRAGRAVTVPMCESCPLLSLSHPVQLKIRAKPNVSSCKSVRAYSPFPNNRNSSAHTCNSGKSSTHSCQCQSNATPTDPSGYINILAPPPPSSQVHHRRNHPPPFRSGITKLWV